MTDIENRNFRRLLAAWNDHQNLRRKGAALTDLSASRARLDSARVGIRNAA